MNRLLFMLMLSSLLLVGYDYQFQRIPRQIDINSQLGINQQLSGDLEKARESKKKAMALQEQIEEIRKESARLALNLPHSDEVGDLLRQITQFARPTLRFDSVMPGQLTAQDLKVLISQGKSIATVKYRDLEIDLRLTARFRSLARYLEYLEKNPRMIAVSELRLSALSFQAPLQASMKVKSYVFAD